ncbi:MAG: mRNA surveillance protein pelota [Nanoarchaeota archaeon]|nr:mRNA surveillance protein pelota [Nanoarchaeota archaeon]MBU4242035.1 mRNA surveillance protein pelota [Nanoarchaeota archaeon]MBU4351568.1 mRNA surveillance protein pelota [Nanoarchaeota archaeon]MBU4456205.1 mRNA surveillance protein pelota [Nanoarchaeota archaeon]MCG2719626.1 mRNA surveillance protein pelota [Nanoarchaeota archaeon]
MKVIFKNFKAGELKVKIDSQDDLWSLSQIIEPTDMVSGKTLRKIKKGDSEAKTTIVKKPVTLSLEVEKIDFHPYSANLRVSGIVKEGPEDVPHGSHHTFDVEEGTIIKITKNHWYKYQIDKVEEAIKQKDIGILICIMDREEAGFALLKQYGYEWLSSFKGDVNKKGLEDKKEPTFYADISKQIDEYVKRYKIEQVIVASPAFWKEDLMKVLKKKYSNLIKKITLATCCETGRDGITEVLKRDEVKTVLQQQRMAKEIELVDRLLSEISKDELAVYGFAQVRMAAETGAVDTLLVTDNLIKYYRQKNIFAELDSVMKIVDKSKGKIVIVSSEHDGGKELDGLGGIGAILRYKINY